MMRVECAWCHVSMGEAMGPENLTSHGICKDCMSLSEDDRAWELKQYGRCLTAAERKAGDEAARVIPPLISFTVEEIVLTPGEPTVVVPAPRASKRPDRNAYIFDCFNCGTLFDHEWHWNEKDPCVVTCPCGTKMATDTDDQGPYTTEIVSTPEHGETCPCASCRKDVVEAGRRLSEEAR